VSRLSLFFPCLTSPSSAPPPFGICADPPPTPIPRFFQFTCHPGVAALPLVLNTTVLGRTCSPFFVLLPFSRLPPPAPLLPPLFFFLLPLLELCCGTVPRSNKVNFRLPPLPFLSQCPLFFFCHKFPLNSSPRFTPPSTVFF